MRSGISPQFHPCHRFLGLAHWREPDCKRHAPPTPYAGAQLQIATDSGFNIIVADITSTSSAPYLGTPGATVADDLMGDSTYYWRVRPRYLNAGIYFGASE